MNHPSHPAPTVDLSEDSWRPGRAAAESWMFLAAVLAIAVTTVSLVAAQYDYVKSDLFETLLQ